MGQAKTVSTSREPRLERNERVRTFMLAEIRDSVQRRGLSQAQAAKKAGVHTPRINALMRGHVDLFSLDALFDIAEKLGVVVDLNTERLGVVVELNSARKSHAGQAEFAL